MSFPSKSLVAASLAATAMFSFPTAASASLVYDASIQTAAQGFGTAPRDLTLQATGNASTESGGVSFSSTGIMFGGTGIIALGNPLLHDPNSVYNSSSTADLPNPLADNQKYGVPTTTSLGITSANQIGVLFNGTESAGNLVNVTDLTLKFYSSTGTLLGAIDGSQTFNGTVAGNGVAGFTFRVSVDEIDYVNGLLAAGGTTLALESTITGVNGGPESYLIYNLGTVNAVPEPETYALMLAGLGVLGFVAKRRKV